MAEALVGLFELLLQGTILLIEGVGRLLSCVLGAFGRRDPGAGDPGAEDGGGA